LLKKAGRGPKPSSTPPVLATIHSLFSLQWSDPQNLLEIGQYATNAYQIFCHGEWRKKVGPQDKDIYKY